MFYILILVVFFFCGQSCDRPTDSDRHISQAIQSLTENSEISSADIQPTVGNFHPFYIYKDRGSKENHFIPSGFMPDGKCVNVHEGHQERCNDGSCIKIVFDVPCAKENQNWAGVYWQYPANNWGQRKGGFNLVGASKLKFWARGEKGGEQIQEFIVGGIMGTYPDSSIASIGPVLLTPDWKEYTIDLRGKDLSYINGGFAWTTNANVNPESCIFYLDDISFE